MALGGLYNSKYTEEEVRLFYPILEKEYTMGYQMDCPLRADLRFKHGMKALHRLRDFTQTVVLSFPGAEDTLPSLEQLLQATAELQKSSVPSIILPSDEEPERRKMRCRLM